MSKEIHSSLPKYVTFGFIGIVVLCYALIPDFRSWLSEAYDVLKTGDKAQIRDWLSQYQNIGPYILLSAFLLQMFLFVIPSVVVMSLCILMYGPWWGSLLCLGGIFIASSIAYFIGRSLSTVTIDKLVGSKSREKMEDFLEDYGFWTVFVFRLSAFLSNDAVSFVGGLVKMNYWRFIAATMLGIAPLTALLAWMGGEETGSMQTGLIIAGAVSLVALVVFIVVDKRRKKKAKA